MKQLLKSIFGYLQENHRERRWHTVMKYLKEFDNPTFIEIGVYRGRMAQRILPTFKGTYIGVDPYIQYWDKPKDNQLDMNKVYIDAHNLFSSFGAELFRTTSLEYAKTVPNDSVDIVFIDGDHSYKAVKQDIKAWLPKIKKGGYLMGHDYEIRRMSVVNAVNDSFDTDKIRVYKNGVWVIKK